MPSKDNNIGNRSGRVAIFILAAMLVMSMAGNAQEGGLPLTHFSESRLAEDQNWAICQDGYNIMLFANRRGVVTFDGYSWDLIRVPVIPYTMVYDYESERVFIGGENSFGYLSRNSKGIYEYSRIETDSSFKGIVTGIILTDSLLYVMSAGCIVIHSLADLEPISLIGCETDETFTSIFEAKGNIYISLWSEGLCRLEGDSIVPLLTAYMTAWDEILFVLPYDDRCVLVGLGSNSMHLFDGLEFYGWEAEDEGYIGQNLLAGGYCINDTLYLFSTYEGGVVVAGRHSRRVYHIINYESGLPDNEVYAVGSDNNSGLWISYEFGLTRADLSLPVRSFSIYPGLKGNLISSLWYNDRLYAATSDGLYILTEVRKYDTAEVLRRVANTLRRGADPVDGQSTGEPPAREAGDTGAHTIRERRNIFNVIFGKRITAEKAATVGQVSPVPVPVERPQPQPEYSYVRRSVTRLRSIHHEFRKVQGIDDKCKQLMPTPGGILAATNRGLYCVSDSTASPIVTGRFVNRIGDRSTGGKYYVATNNGYFSVTCEEGIWRLDRPFPGINRAFYSVATDGEENLWLGAENSLLMVSRDRLQGPAAAEYKLPAEWVQRYHVEYMRDTLFLMTESGIYYFDSLADSLVPLIQPPGSPAQPMKYIFTENNEPWFIRDNSPVYFGSGSGWSDEEQSLLRLFGGIASITSSDKTLWVTDAANRIFRVETGKPAGDGGSLELYIGGVSEDAMPFLGIDRTEFEPGHGLVNLTLVSPYYINQHAVQYRYEMSGVTNGWTEWSSSPLLSLLVKPGNYTLKVMSRAVTGVVSDIRSFQFRVKPRVTETTWFWLVTAIIALLAIFLSMRMRENKLLKAKKILEDKVIERTAEIAAQKQEITSSIEYASRIQMAMLPEDDLFRETFPDHFILFRPRNIVSGDFFWIAHGGGRVFLTAADCTGHGVPGAFMSMLGISSLNEIINSNTHFSAAEVLDQLRERIKSSLKQTGRQGEAADGIDMSLCIYDKGSSIIEFAAAYNSLVHFRASKITEYRGDRMPIGIFYGEEKKFTNNVIRVQEGDAVYLFTDGFTDQFGGTDHTKYKIKNLKLLLSSIKDLRMDEQRSVLEDEFNRWRGECDQVDDVTVIGLRF